MSTGSIGNFEGFVRTASEDKWLEVHGIEHWTPVYLINRDGRLVGRATGPHDWGTPTARAFIRELLAPAPR
jgi:hypothetical protein